MSLKFEIQSTREPARRGHLLTPHGTVQTPVFMPVGTQATVKGVPQDVLEELGVEILLGNTYHLMLRPGVEQIRNLDGSSNFLGPEQAIEAEIGLGADIIMAFDECTEYPADASRTRASMEMTL